MQAHWLQARSNSVLNICTTVYIYIYMQFHYSSTAHLKKSLDEEEVLFYVINKSGLWYRKSERLGKCMSVLQV
jgi:phosphoribosyl-AMP cyclohydrolase